MKHPVTALCVLLVGTLGSGGCTLDDAFFAPERVDEYRWEEADPQLDGDLSDPHPSRIDVDHREEGFVEVEARQAHYVLALRDGASDTIVYSHGNSEHLGRYWDRVELLWELGFHVLVYDYPGYGRSTGSPSETGIYENAAAVLGVLEEHPGVDTARLWFYGFSLGGAAATEMALRGARAEGLAPLGVILESTFCSAEAMLQDASFLDVPDHFLTDLDLDNCGKIGALGVPALILHGEEDDFIVPRHARRLFERATSGSELHVTPGAGHSDVPLVLGEAYDRLLSDFTQ